MRVTIGWGILPVTCVTRHTLIVRGGLKLPDVEVPGFRDDAEHGHVPQPAIYAVVAEGALAQALGAQMILR